MKLVLDIDRRVSTEHQCVTITELHGSLLGTANLGREALSAIFPAIMAAVPRCRKLVFESGCDIQFVAIESINRKEFPSEGTYHTDRLENTEGLFGTFFC